MKNIHILPTDKPSRLVLDSINNNLFLTTTKSFPSDIMKFKNIYITDDSEIKDNDYAFYIAGNMIQKIKFGVNVSNSKAHKKIVLTTDQDLIKDGVQAIPDEFLKWFIKNPSCERVEVEKIMECEKCGKEHCDNLQCRGYKDIPYYKIIIPKEEPKQETLEEANFKVLGTKTDTFYNGAKWQQERMYSEEETIQLLIKFNQEIQEVEDVIEWFEQFKKK